MLNNRSRIATYVAIAVAVLVLAWPNAANAAIIASQDFTGDTALGDSSFWASGGGFTLDTVNEEVDFVKSGALQVGEWDLGAGGEGVVDDLTDGDTFTLSFDARVNSLGADARTGLRLGTGDTNSNRKMIRLRWEGVDGASTFELDIANATSTGAVTGYAVGSYHHIDIVFNRSGAALTDYKGTSDLADDEADVWVNGVLVGLGLDLDGYGFLGAGNPADVLLLRGGNGDDSDISFDNFEIRDEAYVYVDLNPNPAHKSTVSVVDTTELSWTLPEPNDLVNGTVTCDVWFTDDYSGYGLFAGDPNFTNYADKIVGQVSGPEAVTFVKFVDIQVALEQFKTYYWRIDTYDDSTLEPQPVIGPVFWFDTNNQAPVVEAGDDVVTWLDDGLSVVYLAGRDIIASVSDDDVGTEPVEPEWTVTDQPDPDNNPAIMDNGLELNPTVALTATGTYTLQLDADDGLEAAVPDTMTITVYSDSCEAAKETGVELRQSDFNEDCVTDFADFAEFAMEWLESVAL